jgi:hypothetical protein
MDVGQWAQYFLSEQSFLKALFFIFPPRLFFFALPLSPQSKAMTTPLQHFVARLFGYVYYH